MTGALRISGKATYVWNYKQCTKYWPLVQNVGSLSSRTSQGPISTLTGSLQPHSRTHINRATKGTPMRLLFYLSGCGACVFSLSLWNHWVPTTLLKLGILYFCLPQCLGPDLNLGASQGESRTLISTSLQNYLFPYLLSCSRVFLVPTPRYSLHNML